jgi:hypothetical protein
MADSAGSSQRQLGWSHGSMKRLGNAPAEKKPGLKVESVKALENMGWHRMDFLVKMCINYEHTFFAWLLNG